MIISLRKWLRMMKYLLVFVVLAYMLYALLGWVDGNILSSNKYRIPEGSAVKVFKTGSSVDNGTELLSDRLKLFFWYGE